MNEPLFPRYMFIELSLGESTEGWGHITLIKGVSRLVCFGIEPVRVSDGLIELLRTREASEQTKSVGGRVRLLGASTVRRHRSRLPNGRWWSSGYGVVRDAEQRGCRASRGD